MVFLIALLPALVVVIVGLLTKSKAATFVTALIAGLVGLTGGPAYTLIDLTFVAIAYVITVNSIKGSQQNQTHCVDQTVISRPGPVYHRGDRIDENARAPNVTPKTRATEVQKTTGIDEPWEVKRVKKDVADLFMKGRVAEVQSRSIRQSHQEILKTASVEVIEKLTAEFQEKINSLQVRASKSENDASDLKARVFDLVSQKKMSQKNGDSALNTIASAISKLRSV